MKSLLDAMAMNHSNRWPLLDRKGRRASRNVADLTEQLDAQEHREFRSGTGICQYMTEQRFDICLQYEGNMREAAGPTAASKIKLKPIARYFKGRQRWECWQSVRAPQFDIGL